MKTFDKNKENSSIESPLEKSITCEKPTNTSGHLPQVDKPLMRYFDLIEDVNANDSYVLGYN
jgi:hypothetical protein